MTRETKIGLLVGLAFIIVIGILLSDHLTSSTEPPQAKLSDAGPSVRGTVNTLGSQAPPINVVPATDVQPQQTVLTQSELQPKSEGVQIVKVGPGATSPTTAVSEAPSQSTPSAKNDVVDSKPVQARDTDKSVAGADPPVLRSNTQTELARAAAKHNEVLVDADGHPISPIGSKEYTAEPGDTLFKIAAKTMGGSGKANRDALVRANPSLQAAPDKIIIGKTYIIPTDSAPAVASNTQREIAPSKEPREVGEYWYTAKAGDSLWKIANEQLRNPSAVAALKDLNADILKGSENLQIGMKLRLPAKPVAMAD
jgi:LysM repeat protein